MQKSKIGDKGYDLSIKWEKRIKNDLKEINKKIGNIDKKLDELEKRRKKPSLKQENLILY